MPVQGQRDLSWISHSLHAACQRVTRVDLAPKVLTAVYTQADQRLLCILQAVSREAVSDLFKMALLPPADILDVIELQIVAQRQPPA